MDSADCGITRKPEIILSVPPPTKEDIQDGSISLEENRFIKSLWMITMLK